MEYEQKAIHLLRLQNGGLLTENGGVTDVIQSIITMSKFNYPIVMRESMLIAMYGNQGFVVENRRCRVILGDFQVVRVHKMSCCCEIRIPIHYPRGISRYALCMIKIVYKSLR